MPLYFLEDSFLCKRVNVLNAKGIKNGLRERVQL